MTTQPAAEHAVVSAIVVLYNSSPVLPGLLASLPAASQRVRTHVLVVDNASTDRAESRRIAEEHGAAYLQLDENLGYGAGVNAGFASLQEPGDYVLVLNADLEFQPGAIDELVGFAASHPGLGSVGPAILNEDGTVYPSARRSPSLRVGIGHALLGDIAPRNRWSQTYREETTPATTPREADWLSGACLLVPADRFRELGGFDEGYFMYFEDVDLGDRLRTAGWHNVYVPDARVTHVGGHSTGSSSSRMLAVHHQSAYRYLSRRYRGWWLAPVRLALRIGLALRMHATVARNDRRGVHNGRTAASG